MLRSDYHALMFAAVGVLLLGGCRTYGGYDAEPKMYEAMQRTVQSFEDELGRAKADLRRLEKAAAEADTLQALAEQFHGLVNEHASLLDAQHHRVERLSADASHRALHKAYGATITEQRMMRQKYQRAIRTVRATVQDTVAQASPPETNRKYTVRPVGFPAPENERQLSMEQALQGL